MTWDKNKTEKILMCGNKDTYEWGDFIRAVQNNDYSRAKWLCDKGKIVEKRDLFLWNYISLQTKYIQLFDKLNAPYDMSRVIFYPASSVLRPYQLSLLVDVFKKGAVMCETTMGECLLTDWPEDIKRDFVHVPACLKFVESELRRGHFNDLSSRIWPMVSKYTAYKHMAQLRQVYYWR